MFQCHKGIYNANSLIFDKVAAKISTGLYTGQNRRFDRCILDWTSWTASKEASPEGKVLDMFKRSKHINKN